jgi:tripartite ATP-independent transporter DctM subunit
MDPVIIGLIGLVVFLGLMFLGLPVAYSMMLVGCAGVAIISTPGAAYQIIANDVYSNFSSYTLCVAPMFALMGFLANYSGIGAQLFKVADSFLGHVRGGLASAVQAACAVFGAICGSMPATIATMATIAYPEMKKYKYGDSLSTASIAAGASLAILIPPSMTFIIYGIATETSIGRLFMAGIIPGVILMFLYMGGIMWTVKRHPELAPTAPKASWSERRALIKQGGMIEVVIIFFVSIGGMFAGLFTPTEAGAVGAFALLCLGMLERKIGFTAYKKSLFDTSKLVAMVFFLIAAATVYGRFFALSGIPRALGNFINSLNAPDQLIVFVIILIYAVLGCFIDALAMVLLTIPIFYPVVVTNLGYDPIWFGVLVVSCLIIGALTPPVGMNCFVTKGVVKEVPLMTIFSGVWPFVIANVILCVLITLFPSIALFLPTLIYG